MKRRGVTKPITDLWLSEFIVDGHCGLCGNSGKINTIGISTPAGKPCGGRFYCICPNGRSMKYQTTPRKPAPALTPEPRE